MNQEHHELCRRYREEPFSPALSIALWSIVVGALFALAVGMLT